ncbi:MAG: hypothetical protein R2862_02695 [Thermoanaerobaculia bacterium]
MGDAGGEAGDQFQSLGAQDLVLQRRLLALGGHRAVPRARDGPESEGEDDAGQSEDGRGDDPVRELSPLEPADRCVSQDEPEHSERAHRSGPDSCAATPGQADQQHHRRKHEGRR